MQHMITSAFCVMKERCFCFFSLQFFYIFNKKTLNSAACKKSFPFYVPSRERNVDEWRESCNSEAPSEALNALLTQANISLAHSSEIHFLFYLNFQSNGGSEDDTRRKDPRLHVVAFYSLRCDAVQFSFGWCRGIFFMCAVNIKNSVEETKTETTTIWENY